MTAGGGYRRPGQRRVQAGGRGWRPRGTAALASPPPSVHSHAWTALAASSWSTERFPAPFLGTASRLSTACRGERRLWTGRVRTPPSGGAAGLGSAGPWTAPRFLGRTTPPVVGCRGPRKSRVSQLPSTRANQTGAEARTRRRGVCPGPSGRRGRHPEWAETEEEEPAPPDCRAGRPAAGEELASVLFRLRLAWVVRA